jgi:hypothetical protein
MTTPTTPVRLPGDPIPPPPEPRYPWRVAVTMFGLVALVLLVVWLGFQAIRSPETSGQFPAAPTATEYARAFQATVSAADTAEPRSTRPPTPQPTAAPTRAPTAVSATAAAPAATPQVATTVPAPALVRPPTTTSGIGATTSTPAVSVTQVAARSATGSPVPTVDPELASQVSSAYARYWQVLADADWSNDPSALDQVAAGEQLATLRNNISEDQSLNRATRVRVQHSYSVVSAHDDQAQVEDHIQDLSVYVDPITHEPLPGEVEPSSAEAAPTTDATFQLQLLDGTWKVVSATRTGGGS